MNKIYLQLLTLFVVLVAIGCNSSSVSQTMKQADGESTSYILSAPKTDGSVSVEAALQNRRSYRRFIDKEIGAEQLSQILWAAYGVTKLISDIEFLRGGLRTAPSAGALYPFEIYVLVGNVQNIEPGVYKYNSQEHKITKTIDKDIRAELCEAALNQKMIEKAPVVVVYSAIFSRTTGKYGQRGRERYVCMDLGHSAQNIYLQVEALQLGTCAIAAFNDDKVAKVMQLPSEEEPLYIMPIGYY